MIIEKGKILWKPRNAGIAYGGSAYIGIFALGVNIRVFLLMRNIYILKNRQYRETPSCNPHSHKLYCEA
jgi:hypothetical protein